MWKRTTQQAHQGIKAGGLVTALHPLGQLISAGAGGATGSQHAVEAVFDHLRPVRRDVGHLMPVGSRIHPDSGWPHNGDKYQAHGRGRTRSASPAAAPAQSRDGLAGHPACGHCLCITREA
jgi:hypothetical protein